MTESKISELSLEDAQARRRVLVKELLTFRLSLDPNGIQTEGGVAGVQRSLREVDLRIATLKSEK